MTEHSLRVSTPDRVGAVLLAACALIQVALILHHPVAGYSAPAAGGGSQYTEIAAVIGANRSFHAILMLLVVGQLTGLALFARRLGIARPLVLAGGLLSGLAAVFLLLATTFDGFVTFELIARCSSAASGCSDATGGSLRMILASVQAFTKVGLGAQCLALAVLAGGLVTKRRSATVLGSLGVLLALAPLGLLAFKTYIDAELIMLFLLPHALWSVGAASILNTPRSGGSEN